MTQCTRQMLLFKDISTKKVAVDFEGGRVSSDAGWLLLRETEARLGLIRRMAEALRDRRHPSFFRGDEGRFELVERGGDVEPQALQVVLVDVEADERGRWCEHPQAPDAIRLAVVREALRSQHRLTELIEPAECLSVLVERSQQAGSHQGTQQGVSAVGHKDVGWVGT